MGNKTAKPSRADATLSNDLNRKTWTPGQSTTPGDAEGELGYITENEPESKELAIVVVNGCGINQCNGRYYESGTRNGCPYFEHFDHGTIFCIMYHAAAWRLARKSRSESEEGIRWFYVSDDGYFKSPPQSGWQLDARGQWPPPSNIEVKNVPNPFLEIQQMILASEVRRWYTRRLRLRKNRTYNIINLVNTFRVSTADLPGLRDEVIDGMDEMDREVVLKKKSKKKRKRKPKVPSPSLATGVTAVTTTTTTTVKTTTTKKVEVFKTASPKARRSGARPRGDSRAEGAPPAQTSDPDKPLTPQSPKARRAEKKKRKKKNKKKTPKSRDKPTSTKNPDLEIPGTPTVPDVPFPDDEGSEEMEGFSWEGMSRIPTMRHDVQTLHVGGVVEIHGLTGRAADVFNGRLGVLHRYLEDKDAWGVMLDEDTECILLSVNLQRVIPHGWEEHEHETGVKIYKDTQRSLDLE